MNIPVWIIEGSNWATIMALMIVLAFQFAFLTVVAVRFSDIGPFSFYRHMKPVIALTVAFAGHLLRFVNFARQQLLEDHGIIAPLGQWFWISIHIVGTEMVVIGMLCWLRVTMPQIFGFTTWVAMVLAVMVVGLMPSLM